MIRFLFHTVQYYITFELKWKEQSILKNLKHILLSLLNDGLMAERQEKEINLCCRAWAVGEIQHFILILTLLQRSPKRVIWKKRLLQIFLWSILSVRCLCSVHKHFVKVSDFTCPQTNKPVGCVTSSLLTLLHETSQHDPHVTADVRSCGSLISQLTDLSLIHSPNTQYNKLISWTSLSVLLAMTQRSQRPRSCCVAPQSHAVLPVSTVKVTYVSLVAWGRIKTTESNTKKKRKWTWDSEKPTAYKPLSYAAPCERSCWKIFLI